MRFETVTVCKGCRWSVHAYKAEHGARLTDAQGRFELTNLPKGATLQFQVYKPGYVQQCASPRLLVNGNLQLNAQIVASANVSASRESVPPSAPGNRMIFGVV